MNLGILKPAYNYLPLRETERRIVALFAHYPHGIALSNQDIADKIWRSPTTVSQTISNLRRLGLIGRQYLRDGRRVIYATDELMELVRFCCKQAMVGDE